MWTKSSSHLFIFSRFCVCNCSLLMHISLLVISHYIRVSFPALLRRIDTTLRNIYFKNLHNTSQMIHSFYLFDRHCNCIYTREWSLKDDGAINRANESNASKLLFGLVYSLKNILSKLGSTEAAPNLLKSFATKNYRIHIYETASGFRFCLISDVNLDNLQPMLHHIYTEIFIRTVVLNGLSPIDFQLGEKISNSNFIIELDSFVQSSSVFSR